jgi:predicted small lipoprotein YifL
MKRCIRNFVALSAALAALATCGFARAQEIPVVDVALVEAAPIQFHPLPSPSASLAVQRMVQDRYGFLWLSAADGLQQERQLDVRPGSCHSPRRPPRPAWPCRGRHKDVPSYFPA